MASSDSRCGFVRSHMIRSLEAIRIRALLEQLHNLL
ncbi:unnamed protein product [Arabidopsis lyrata]|nr:unnamed protein product [Arabidopsis lyrata]